MQFAACAGMAPRRRGEEDIFFPPKGRADLARRARAICSTCPVTIECDDHRNATNSSHGIWGGERKPKKNTPKRGS